MKVGIDIGGTKVALGIVDKNKIIKNIFYLLSKEEKNERDVFFHRIIEEIHKISQGYKISGIGVASPGPLDSGKGIVLNTPNIKSLRNVNIINILKNKFGVKVLLEHDSNAAAIAEADYFNKRNLVYLSLGTGAGNSIIIDKKIYKGLGNAAEGGHMTINFDGIKANCNNSGCLEEYVSARGINSIGKKYGFDLAPKEIEEIADQGNKKAIDVYKEMGFYLGVGLANFVNILQPEMIVLGGGISKASRFFLPEAIRVVRERSLIYDKRIKIEASRLGYKAGILGAAMLLGTK